MTVSIQYLTEQNHKYDSLAEAQLADAVETAGIYIEDYKMRQIATALCDRFQFHPKRPLPAQVQELLDAEAAHAAQDTNSWTPSA